MYIPKDSNIKTLIERLKNKIEGVNGVVLAAGNSDGKTRILKELAQSYYDDRLQCIYIPEYIKDLETDLGGLFDTGEKKELEKPFILLADRLTTKRNDDIKGTIVHMLKKNQESPIFKFFKDKLKFELSFDEDGNIKIKRNKKRVKEELTSTGFKLMIRITAEIYFYLMLFDNSKTTYILVDEIDDKLYWNNRSIFFKELFKFLEPNFPNIKFIFSTNMPESIYSLPRKVKNTNVEFKIVKIYQDEDSIISYQSYDSSDFLTENSIDKVIFDKKTTFINKSENYKELEKIYMYCFKCKKRSDELCENYINCIYIKYPPDSLVPLYPLCRIYSISLQYTTIKEKILYDAIMELRR
ncbi:hypothetical protein [Cetobacterium sp.]|uniref:hypothetical protein n=1 Tax=Cetobacterium sp. TaxID=2071632 RepID=UPI002FCC5D48